MSEPIRVAGRAPVAGGGWLTWTVADGHRGRRWRTVLELGGQVLSSVLLEVDPDGRFAKLELASSTGLLSLHPEGNSELDGNAVLADGIRHFALGWGPDHALEVEGLVVATAVTLARLTSVMTVGEGRTLPSVQVTSDLLVIEGEHRYVRVGAREWRVEGDGDLANVAIDGRGMPAWSHGAVEWPLEVHPHDR